MGSDEEFGEMLTLIERTQLRPVIDSVRPFSETKDALDRMREGGQFGKLVLTMDAAAPAARL